MGCEFNLCSAADRPDAARYTAGMSSSVVILTGAGVSAESGLSTFRGAGGLWEGHRVEEVATPEAWAADPQMVWRFYQMRRAALHSVQPNPGHLAHAALEKRLEELSVPNLLITQNVDDLHDRAGSHPLHMHGELACLRCEVCGHTVRELTSLDPERFVPCPTCEHPRLRPDFVWFGEMPHQMQRIESALSDCTHFVSAGTSGAVYPAAGFLSMARQVGARTYVNSLDEPSNLSPADEFLPGPATEVLPAIAERLLIEVA